MINLRNSNSAGQVEQAATRYADARNHVASTGQEFWRRSSITSRPTYHSTALIRLMRRTITSASLFPLVSASSSISPHWRCGWTVLLADNAINDDADFKNHIGNFGDVLAGFFAKKLGVPSGSLVVATNENDILHRFWQTGAYEKNPVHGSAAEGGFVEDGTNPNVPQSRTSLLTRCPPGAKAHPSGVKETLSPAMDILVSKLLYLSDYRRLLQV